MAVAWYEYKSEGIAELANQKKNFFYLSEKNEKLSKWGEKIIGACEKKVFLGVFNLIYIIFAILF